MKIDFNAIAQVVSAAKTTDAQVINLKAQLNAAELSAAYNNPAAVALMDAVAEDVFKSIAISEGAKWDNKAQSWDKKGAAVIANLRTLAKNNGDYYYNFDNKVSVTLDTEARAESFKKALKKEYIRTKKEGVKTRERKDLAERIKAQYAALSSLLTGDMLISAVAGALHTTEAKVREAIK